MTHAQINTLLAVIGLTLPIVVGLMVRKAERHRAKIFEQEKNLALKTLELEKQAKEEIAEGHKELVAQVTRLQANMAGDSQTLALLKQEMLPMSEFMKRKLIDVLMHPSEEFKIPDKLLKQVAELGAPMPAELAPLLEERVHSDNPHVTEQEKLAAQALPIITRMAELEAKEVDSLVVTGIQLVSSTIKSHETKKEEEHGTL